MKAKAKHVFLRGIWGENPVFVMVLGMCSVLAVSTQVINGLGMGLAVTFVLTGSNLVIALLRKFIDDKIRIPAFVVIIAAFTTIVQLLMKAYVPDIDAALGIFIPLIVVNCIILARAETCASKNNVLIAVVDGLGMGLGYTLAITLLSLVRELLGSGTVLGHPVMDGFTPILMVALAPGGFIVLGLLLAGIQWLAAITKEAKRRKEEDGV